MMNERRERKCNCENFVCHQFGPVKSHIYDKKTGRGEMRVLDLEECVIYKRENPAKIPLPNYGQDF